MGYCRYCGVEISYKRSKNGKWIPCNFFTGEPHFCNTTYKSNKEKETGILACRICGKPIFISKVGKTNVYMDYTSLEKHKCKKIDITNYEKYKKRQKALIKKN